jgi:hypothetical protein
MRHYSTRFTVDQTPEQVFASIHDVPAWWSGEVKGSADRPGAEFTYEVPGVHWSRQKVTVFEPGKKAVWRVVDSKLDFAGKKDEWTGTEIVFAMARKDGKTEVAFSHVGLVPAFECYGNCSDAWTALIQGNLRKFI